MSAAKLNVVDGKRTAYTAAPEEATRTWGVSICVEGEAGHRPISEYSGYDEKRAKGIAVRLNERIGVSPAEADEIVRSTIMASIRESKTKKTRVRRAGGRA